MNVLHEIEVKKWGKTFKNIEKILTDDGVLIFIEVLSLAKGEQPYGSNGYLILQDEQVKLLFNDTHIINLRVDSKEKSNCWLLTKPQVGNVTQETIERSISSLKNSSYRALWEEYEKRIMYAHGIAEEQEKQMAARQYAFLSQQYINALLAYKSLQGEESKKYYTKKVANVLGKDNAEKTVKVII